MHTTRSPGTTGLLMLTALMSGCGPSPYDAFVECRRVIEQAATLAETGSCFLHADADFLQDDAERQEFLAELAEPPLAQLSLVREDELDTDDAEQQVALRFDVSDAQPSHAVSGYSAIMRRLDGRWWYERQGIFVHGDYDNASQADVGGSMELSGAVERDSDRIVAGYHIDGEQHALVLKDRFDGATVRFSSQQPFEPGQYALGNTVAAEVMLDYDRYFTKGVAGELEVRTTGDSGLSGSFHLQADSNHSGPIEASGDFTGVPEIALR